MSRASEPALYQWHEVQKPKQTQGSGFSLNRLGFRVYRVWGLGFRAYGLGFRVAEVRSRDTGRTTFIVEEQGVCGLCIFTSPNPKPYKPYKP